MRSRQRSPIWPYLGILACLFVLSLTAPKAWHRMARREPLGRSNTLRAPALPADPARIAIVAHENDAIVAQEVVAYETIDASELPAQDEISRQPSPCEPTADIATAATSFEPSGPDPGVVPPAPDLEPEATYQADPASETSNLPAENETIVPDEQPLPESEEAPAASVPPVNVSPESDPAGKSSAWPLPRVLLNQLDQLAEANPNLQWPRQAIATIRELCQFPSPARSTAPEILARLREIVDRSGAPASDAPDESRLGRTRYALTRWLAIWDRAIELDKRPEEQHLTGQTANRMALRIRDIESLTTKGAAGAAWRQYLLLDHLRRLASDESAKDDERRATARKVLDRLAPHRLTRSQQNFASEPGIANLDDELRSWAAEPVSPNQLLTHIEQYELTGLSSDARRVANDWRGLNWSKPAPDEQIGRQLDAHYRNANLRIAMSGMLLNRFVPQPQKIDAPVRDTIVNVPVQGRSTTFTKLYVRPVPDPKRIRLGIEAEGLVASNTVSKSGPAMFRNQGQSSFLVRKLLVLGPQGLSVWPAVAAAENNFSYLVSLETDFDGVPLVGSLVRNIARSQHDEALGEAKMEIEQKVATRARDQLDAEIRPVLIKAAKNIEKRQVATLQRLGLELVPVSLSTSEERIAARMRLGTPEQLGAHTPRPRAPSDSCFSLQIHQSAINNVLEQLDLGGRNFTLPELFAWIARKLDRPQLADQEDLPEDVHIRFADIDPIRVRCDAEQVAVTLSIAELTQNGKTWRDFNVDAKYAPKPNGRDPRFVREGIVSLEGKSLNGKPQFILRAIFSKVLSRNRDVSLLDSSLTSDPRFKDLEITQMSVEDGWIALAYRAHRVPDNVVRSRKPATTAR